MTKRLFFLILCCCIGGSHLHAQPNSTPNYHKEAQELLGYFNFMLNAMGDSSLSPREKDIIVTDSYTKLFRDDKVQIEDDLIAGREAVANKDVQAYLKDVDFFYRQVQFQYQLIDMQQLTNEQGNDYLKLHCKRTLIGTPIDHDTLIKQQQERYIEISIAPEARDLKIVSVYTQKINEREATIAWWNGLSLNWKELLGQAISFDEEYRWSDLIHISDKALVFKPIYTDTTLHAAALDTLLLYNDSLQQTYRHKVDAGLTAIRSLKHLDVSQRSNLFSIQALSELSNMQSLNIAGTMVSDLRPLRNLLKLTTLNISHTPVASLSALSSSSALLKLDASHSAISSIQHIAQLEQLQSLNISHTKTYELPSTLPLTGLRSLQMAHCPISQLYPLSQLTKLQQIDISHCPANNIQALDSLTQLQELYISHTAINNLQALRHATQLQELHCDYTMVNSLSPLAHLRQLKKIYCDGSPIPPQAVATFVETHPHTLVVWESDKIAQWYVSLPQAWRQLLQQHVSFPLNNNISREQLHQLLQIDSLSLAEAKDIHSLQPIQQLWRLQHLDASKSGLQQLSGIENFSKLQYLNISHTNISDLSPLSTLPQLKKLNISSTPIQKLDALSNISSLQHISATDCKNMDMTALYLFLRQHRQLSVIYQTQALSIWWENLSPAWQSLFAQQQGWNKTASDAQLHRLLRRSSLSIQSQQLADLQTLHMFKCLDSLRINNCQLSSLQQIVPMTWLRSLDVANNPITQLGDMSPMTQLQALNISNTPIKKLDPIAALPQLQVLNISGTPTRRLYPLSKLQKLHTLLAANCRITKLNELYGLPLKKLQIFNNRISPKRIEQYKQKHSQCLVEFY